jgi:dinuclear metal center YbgI/SA1388 family protein
MTVADCIAVLERLAPLDLAEAWDNVGLLVGDRTATVERVMTCLTVTPDVVDEAVSERAQLVVTHHPVLFKPVQRLTADTPEGALLLRLAQAGIAVYSPHTAYDSSHDGINTQLATSLALQDVTPLRPAVVSLGGSEGSIALPVGGGRWGTLPAATTLAALARQVRTTLRAGGVQFIGDRGQSVQQVAVACGSAAEFLPEARAVGCDVLITGEARFHACVEARTAGVALILAGHYATERPAVEQLAKLLADRAPALRVWASRVETDPVQWGEP